MRYLITNDSRRTLATLDVPAGSGESPLNIAIERADEPDLMYASADLYANGTVHVGHWPEGEEWEPVLRTTGVLNPYGVGAPALPGPETFTTAQITQAFTAARERATDSTFDAGALDALVRATLALLVNSASNSPFPDDADE
ncbi:hypothetical protein ACWDZ4_20125 [Streptomyces sp. NPDC003016]